MALRHHRPKTSRHQGPVTWPRMIRPQVWYIVCSTNNLQIISMNHFRHYRQWLWLYPTSAGFGQQWKSPLWLSRGLWWGGLHHLYEHLYLAFKTVLGEISTVSHVHNEIRNWCLIFWATLYWIVKCQVFASSPNIYSRPSGIIRRRFELHDRCHQQARWVCGSTDQNPTGLPQDGHILPVPQCEEHFPERQVSCECHIFLYDYSI